MIHYHHTHPVARKRHLCGMCWTPIRPGERYERAAGMDGSTAWTYKTCLWCIRVIESYASGPLSFGDEIHPEIVIEWLEEAAPTVYRTMLAGWSYPDGERVPIPFPRYCRECNAPLSDPNWLRTCDTCVATEYGVIV